MHLFELTPEQQDLRALAAEVARDVYAPVANDWDEAGTVFPREERKRLADLGFLGITLPTEYGGSGAPLLDALIVIEELGKVSHPAGFQAFEANTGPARVLELFGTPEQKERWLPAIIRGESTMAISISEPEAGSAATDMTTRGRVSGDRIVLNGRKRWTSGGGDAEQYLVYVRLNEKRGAAGIGAVVVDKDTPGLSFGPRERLMGFRSIASADLIFEDCEIPTDHLIIPAGGFNDLFRAFSVERLGNSTMCLAIGQSSLERTAAYVQERLQFGKNLIEFQTVQTKLADMIIRVEASRLLTYRAALKAGTGTPVPLEASIAKCFANEMAKSVSDLAIELHGAYGYSVEYGLERLHRDAHGWAMGGGTPTMQRIRIVADYLNRPLNQRS